MHNEQVYTPSKVVNFILDNVGFDNRCGIEGKHIIDNSCGNGNFLVEIVKRIFQFIPNIDREYLETYVHGIEIDEPAYNETIVRLNKIAIEHNINYVKWDIKNSNALTTTDFDKRMDYVVGNPPYCNVHHMPKEIYDILKTKFLFCRDGMTDLYIGFFEKGLQMLKTDGILGYITPNSWLNSKAGMRLRDFLYERNLLTEIFNFDTDKVFKEATTFTCVAILRSKNTNNDIVVYHGGFEGIHNYKEYRFINKEDLFINGNIMTGQMNYGIREILNYKVQNKEKCFVVKNGLATLKDKLFIIDPDTVAIFTELDNINRCIKASKGEYKYIIYPYDEKGEPISYNDLRLYAQEILEIRAGSLNIDKSRDDWYLYGRTQAIKDNGKYRISCNNLIRDKDDIILRRLWPNTAVYSGFYIMRKGMPQNGLTLMEMFTKIEGAMKTDTFIRYVKSLGKSKNGKYYTFTTKDLEKFLNYFYKI